MGLPVKYELTPIEKINNIITRRRRELYRESYEFAKLFANQLVEFIEATLIYNSDLDFIYFGAQVDAITDKIDFSEEVFWALNEEEFLETKNEVLKYDDVREEVETSFINTGKSLYGLAYNETEWGIIFKVLEKHNFMPFIQKVYSKEFNLSKDYKIVVFFKVEI